MDSLEKNEEITLPKATADKIMHENSAGCMLSRELKDAVTECAIEFIRSITAEANEYCEKELRKTINHDHVYSALRNLGFESFIDECVEAYDEHVKLAKMKPSRVNTLKNSPHTLEELEEKQKLLFESARKELTEEITKMDDHNEADKKINNQ